MANNFFLQSAAKHDIRLRHSNFNKAEGDCAFESAVEQCLFMFRRRIFPGFTVQTHLELRTKTVENLGQSEIARGWIDNLVADEAEFQCELGRLLEQGVWNTKVAGLVIPGIAFTLKKNILIFYTDATLADHPINVFTPGLLGGEVDTNVPLVLAYNRSHYEAMIPETEEDEQKCSQLVELKMSGQYLAEMQNIPLLWNQLPDAVSFLFCIY